MQTRQDQETQGHRLVLELRLQTKALARLINKIPDPVALARAQNLVLAIGIMMMDLARVDPVLFFVAYPMMEKDIAEAQAAMDLMRLRLRAPIVRSRIPSAYRH